MNLLLSTNMYSADTFPRVERYLDWYEELEEAGNPSESPAVRLGVEVFPLFHDHAFEGRLQALIPKLSKVPITFHEPYYKAENTAEKGSAEYWRTTDYFRRTLDYAAMLHAGHIVFHHNNCRVDRKSPEEKQQLLQRACERYRFYEELAEPYGIPILAENVGVLSRGNVLLDQEAFTRLCEAEDYPVLIDIGHANANGWDLMRLMRDLRYRIHAYHLHNNDGRLDSHRRIHDGTLDFDRFMNALRENGRDTDLVLEYSAEVEPDGDGIRADIMEMMQRLGQQ